MHPFLFHIGTFDVPTYPVMLGVAAVVGGLYLWKVTRPGIVRGPSDFALFFNLLVLGAAVGGFGYSLLARVGEGVPGDSDLLHSGLPTFGVMAGVAAAALVYAALEHLPRAAVLDATFLSVPVCHGIARIGCFLAGCCYGKPAGPGLLWAVRFSHTPEIPQRLWGVALHPVQVYEVLGDAVLAALLAFSPLRRRSPGTVFAAAVGGYSLLRFLDGFFRADEVPLGSLSINLSQAVALVAGSLSLAWLVRMISSRRRVEGP